METFMEEREAQMISPSRGKPCFRIAHFLKPSFPISQHQKHLNPPPISTPTKPISQIAKSLSYKINFNGWKNPVKNWSNWVDKLLPKFQSTWKNTSIYEPIIGSKYEIPRFRDSVFSICEKWCPENNTFVFNWGEVTITLEDILVLGGYSVTGDSVLSKISSSELQEVKRNLEVVYSELNNSKSKKVSHYQWMDIWMKKGSEFEHEAFLTLWLSRYVLPAQADGVINKGVFPIAILLARGTKISLAPAILASIYKDLRLLKEKIVWLRELGDQVDGGSVSRLCLSSPLQLLQVWIWERFTTLSPKPNFVTDGIRLQKWHKVANPKNNDVGLAFDAAMESFRWRPYTTSLSNGSICDKLYVEEASWVSVNSDVSIDLESYARIVRNSKLVGLNCVEQYLPHRVSMQFGLDQDIPCVFPRVSDTRNLAWNDYNRPVGDVKMYISSRLFKSDVTMSYLEWWKGLEDVKDNVKCLRKKKDAKTNTKPCQESSKISMLVPPGFSPKSEGVAMSDCFDQLEPCSKRSQVTPCCPETVIEISESETSSALFSKGMKSDEEPDDDRLTLAELFGVKSTQKESRSEALSVNRRERPQSAVADNALIQKITPAKENPENSLPSLECTREELIIEEKNESKVEECQVTTPISTEVNKTQTTFNGTPECPDSPETPKMDILDRIARLQRTFDIYKSAKVGLL